MTGAISTKFEYQGVAIEVWPGVFEPNKTTELLLEAALKHDLRGKSALDLGCGSGVVAVVSTKLGQIGSAHGSDISARAVENGRHNAALAGVTVEFREGSLFEPWAGHKFDIIIDDVAAIADPIARLSPWYPPEITCDAGLDGSANTIKMLEKAKDFLTPGGVLFFPTVSLSNEVKILQVARSEYPRVECLLKKSWPFKDDFWQRIMSNETARRLVDDGVIKVVQRGSRFLWDTSIYMATSVS